MGFEVTGEEAKVYRLHKALYGLRQAPRAWYAKLDVTLIKMGFEGSTSDPAVYKRNSEHSTLIVGVYVDDLVIIGSQVSVIQGFKVEMQKEFKMSDLGLLSFYLGIQVKQTTTGIALNQSAYALNILKKNGMDGCNPCQVPMEARLRLSKESTNSLVDATQYRSLIGSLRYLVNTRPDLAYAVGYLSRFMEKPATDHLAAAKHLLRYVAGTVGWGCWYGRKQSNIVQLTGYCDSDMGGDVDDRKSTIGVVFALGENIITWQSQKQKVVALSSCEAEYIAVTTAACQGIWLARLILEITGDEKKCVVLKVDNKSAISLCKNPLLNDRSKHIDTRFHFIRGYVEKKEIEVEYVRTEEQVADILTKSLGRVKFQELQGRLGMLEIQPQY